MDEVVLVVLAVCGYFLRLKRNSQEILARNESCCHGDAVITFPSLSLSRRLPTLPLSLPLALSLLFSSP